MTLPETPSDWPRWRRSYNDSIEHGLNEKQARVIAGCSEIDVQEEMLRDPDWNPVPREKILISVQHLSRRGRELLHAVKDDGMRRLVEKLMGGMKLETAIARSGVRKDILPEHKELILECMHVPDTRAMEALGMAMDAGDASVALTVLERQTGDFKAAAKEIVVSGGGFRAAWDAVDAELVETLAIAEAQVPEPLTDTTLTDTAHTGVISTEDTTTKASHT